MAGMAPECAMSGMSDDMDGDQPEKGCCTPECAMACPVAAILLDDMQPLAVYSSAEMIAVTEAQSFGSIAPDAADPPPRQPHD